MQIIAITVYVIETIFSCWLLFFVGAMIRNVGAKPTMFMTASEGAVPSVTMSAATSAATVKPPYVVAAVVDPSEVHVNLKCGPI